MTAKLYGPGRVVAIDLADSRLESARAFGANETINNLSEDAVERVKEMTDGLGGQRGDGGGWVSGPPSSCAPSSYVPAVTLPTPGSTGAP